MKKRFVHLQPDEVLTLEEGYKNVTHHQFKQRCHALLLSHKQKDMDTLKDIFDVSLGTISNWFTNWETKGIVGLRNQAGQGRKTILKVADLPLVKEKVQANPQHLKAVREELKAELAKDFSQKTLTRFLKELARPGGVVGGKVSKPSKTPWPMRIRKIA
jgi:transposase